ncbi:MAG: NAD(P)/FAD-dependent oxidoreductase [Candidatus Bathyarchaeia archaeon]
MDPDVIVVGGGPAGSYSALQAAKLGVQVIICEEHNKVGVPSHCTGHISIENLRHFDLRLPKNVFENEIESAVFYSPSGYRFSVRFPSPVTCVINRELFDQHLLNMALEADAKILYNTHVDSLLIEKGYVKGVTFDRNKKTQKLESKVVIDAEGVSSKLLKRARKSFFKRRIIVNGVQAEVDKLEEMEEATVEVFLDRNYAPGFFAWLVPRRDGTAKVGLGTINGNPRDCFHRFIHRNPIVRQRLKQSHITNLVYHPIPLDGPIDRTVYNGLLIVGDAASQVKPTTGGGITMGLTCAEIAGKVAAHAVHNRDSSTNFLSQYESQWRKKIGFDMAAMKRLRFLLAKFSDKQLDKLVILGSRLKLDKDLRNTKDVDLQGTSLIRLAKSPKFAIVALYFLIIGFTQCYRKEAISLQEH